MFDNSLLKQLLQPTLIDTGPIKRGALWALLLLGLGFPLLSVGDNVGPLPSEVSTLATRTPSRQETETVPAGATDYDNHQSELLLAINDSDTDIVAPYVNLKEVAPEPDVLPNLKEANTSQQDGMTTGAPSGNATLNYSPVIQTNQTPAQGATPLAPVPQSCPVTSFLPLWPTPESSMPSTSATDTTDKTKPTDAQSAVTKAADLNIEATLDPVAEPHGTALATADMVENELSKPRPPVASTIKEVIENFKGDKPPLKEREFMLLGARVPPKTSTRLAWKPKVAITGLSLPVPVLVVNGKQPGETLCLTAAIHGDELNGIEVVRRVMYDINPEKLTGQVIGIPIVNLQGFQRASRYLADRRDLNRHFPGDKKGSLASRIAHSLFTEVISHCTSLVDLHTGSLRRSNLPQIRADMSDPKVARFTEDFDEMVVVHSAGDSGMLRTAAQKIGIPAVTLEIGESLRLQQDQVESGVKSINSLMQRRKMYPRLFSWGEPEPIYYDSSWIRAEKGGILFSVSKLGDKVEKGDVLGVVTDPITNADSKIKAPFAGRVIGMAVNQVVMPGFAAYHLGTEATERAISEAAIKAVNRERSPDNEAEDFNPEETDPLESDPLE